METVRLIEIKRYGRIYCADTLDDAHYFAAIFGGMLYNTFGTWKILLS